jgi:hypothetical protein
MYATSDDRSYKVLVVDKRAATAKHFSHCEVLYWPIARKRTQQKEH